MGWMLMPLKRYADFSGRSRRMEFWMWQVFKLLVGFVFGLLFLVMFGAAFARMAQGGDPGELIAASVGAVLLWLVYMIFCLAILVPDFAVAVRRLHDTNRSGWWVLAPIGSYFIGLILVGVTAGAGVSMQPDDQAGSGLLAAGGIVALLTGLVTLALMLVLIVFMFLDGTPGTNRYGPDPKGRGEAEVFA
jgi:uncharacterized membrane protein YhaH (DUF805 family)